ncbi:MAG: DUF3224 domain-containing protein [Acidobacteria bacterium]|nr:DUF3224 domain-containing protein [Acidobacteriota bacterium]
MKELLRLETVWNDAHLQGAAALDELWADDFVVTVPGMALMTKPEVIGIWRSGRLKFQRYQTSDLRIKIYQDTAIVTGRVERSRTINSKAVDDDWRFTKVYMRRAGNWQVIAWHASSSAQYVSKEKNMTMQASGTFAVKVTPVDNKSADASLGRMTLEKQYHGDLEATGTGQMLTAGSASKGSGGYVAIEKVSGSLQGRKGTFMLQHSGTMKGGEAQLTITVVPNSGTDELQSLAGKLDIKIADGKHFYTFEYTLNKTP